MDSGTFLGAQAESELIMFTNAEMVASSADGSEATSEPSRRLAVILSFEDIPSVGCFHENPEIHPSRHSCPQCTCGAAQRSLLDSMRARGSRAFSDDSPSLPGKCIEGSSGFTVVDVDFYLISSSAFVWLRRLALD